MTKTLMKRMVTTILSLIMAAGFVISGAFATTLKVEAADSKTAKAIKAEFDADFYANQYPDVKAAFGTNKIKCSFVDDNIMFAISTNRNVFEIGSIFKSLTKPEIMERFFNELISIYLMIDYFKLNEQTKL